MTASLSPELSASAAYRAGRADALDEAQAYALSSAREFRALAVRATLGEPVAEGFAKIWEGVAEQIAGLKADAA